MAGKAWAAIEEATTSLAGLVGTNSIRSRNNRNVLDRICEYGSIIEPWADEPWSIDGVAVRVSLVCFALRAADQPLLDGQQTLEIYADLTGRDATHGINLGSARRLIANLETVFQGPVKVGPFDVSGDLARQFLQSPLNPNGRPNSDVVKPWANGADVTRRPSDTWIIDFAERSESEASFYETPFKYVHSHVKPLRDTNRRERRKSKWWQHGETVPGLRAKMRFINRIIVTARVSKHRFFVWMSSVILPDSRLVAITREDDTTFGMLHSHIHEVWSLRLGGWHGVGNDPQYTPVTGFETFPFPDGLTPNIPAAQYADDPRAVRIAEVARRLNELRENWLNPSDLVRREPEVVPGYPDRILPVSDKAAKILKKRTLTNLYNERPAWLDNAHRDLDEAVAAAYGWPTDLSDDEILKRLLDLNLARSAAQAA